MMFGECDHECQEESYDTWLEGDIVTFFTRLTCLKCGREWIVDLEREAFKPDVHGRLKEGRNDF